MTKLPEHFNWIIRYKLHHLLFWAVYHYIWWSLYFENPITIFEVLNDPPNVTKYGAYVIFQAIGVYFCLYYLIPQFLIKGKYGIFVGTLALTILGTATIIYYSAYHFSAYIADQDVATRFGLGNDPVYFLFKNNALPSTIASMTLGMSIKLGKNWIASQQRQQQLEKEKLETELKFLKSQFNPHFLFNTINSIFVLINRNTTLASESLAKFSSLLRYQLYECNESQIPLNRELAYLESFIELEKLRLDKRFEVKTNLLPGYKGNLQIAPFILMPFVENAFKHVSQGKDQVNWIKMDMSLEDHHLVVNIANSCSSTSSRDAVNYGGLGLKNVKRRLALLYPQLHELHIDQKEGVYRIELHLDLQEQLQPAIQLIDS